MMKLGLISDTHCYHAKLERLWRSNGMWDHLVSCDVVAHCGDATMIGAMHEAVAFLEWFSKLPVKRKLFVPGNHDFCFDPDYRAYTEKGRQRHRDRAKTGVYSRYLREKYENVEFLVDSGVTIDKIKFWGSPATPWFHDWAWNRQRGEDIRKHWDMIPSNTDVLLTHGPPFMILDELAHANDDGMINVGCKDLLVATTRVKPLVHAFGHIHEGSGSLHVPDEGDGTLFVNCTSLNEKYQPVHDPVIVHL